MPILNGKKVNPEYIDSSKHKYIGQFRLPNCPNTSYIDQDTKQIKFGEVMVCPCGQHIWDKETTFNHWQCGHFDEPQYVDI